jgi:hypothetical protein
MSRHLATRRELRSAKAQNVGLKQEMDDLAIKREERSHYCMFGSNKHCVSLVPIQHPNQRDRHIIYSYSYSSLNQIVGLIYNCCNALS